VRKLLDADALRQKFSMISRISEQQLTRLGALEVKVRWVLPGETNAAVNLNVLGCGMKVSL
jgi:hypothetical protein